MSDFKVQAGFHYSRDAFGRSRVSNPSTIFDSKQILDYGTEYWDNTQSSGSGTSSTYSQNRASTSLAVSNVTAGRRTRVTKWSFNYQPGKSQLFFMTVVLGATATGITRRVGAFTDRNGVFLEQLPSGLNFAVRSFVSGAAVDIDVPQARWSEDPMDGTGPSGITLDVTKAQILMIDFEWLGVGTVRFGFVIDGIPIYVHYQHTANIGTAVYMANPNLPIRFEIENSGTGGAASLECICSSVMSEGGSKDTGISYSSTRGVTPLVTGNDTNIYPLVAIRYLSAAGANTVTVEPKTLSLMSTSGTAGFRWMLLKNPTVTGTAFSWSTISPAVESAFTMTSATTLSGGKELLSGYGLQTNESSMVQIELPRDEQLGMTLAGVSDIYVLAVQKIVGTNETFYGSMNWIELA